MNSNITTGQRIAVLCKLGRYMDSNDLTWMDTQDRAVSANAWFTPTHVAIAIDNIVQQFLQKDKLEHWIAGYQLPKQPKEVISKLLSG